MSNIVIKAENLCKSYIIGYETAGKRERYTALRDVISCKVHNITSKTNQVIGRATNSWAGNGGVPGLKRY